MKRNEAFMSGRLNRREMLKRSAAVAAAVPAFAAAGSLVGPRAVSAQGLSGSLTFWHGLTAEAAVLNDTILPEWAKANPNVKINVLQVPFDQLQNKYNTEASAGGGPDVLLGPSDWVGQYVDSDVVKSLKDVMDDATKATFNDASLALFTLKDTLYAVPQNINGIGFVFNKKLMATAPATTDDLIAEAAKIASANAGSHGFGIFPQFYNNAAYLNGFGGAALTADDKSGFDQQPAIDWLTYLQKLTKSPGVFVGADQNAVESLFKEGKLAAMQNGPWFTQGGTEGVGAENFGVAVLPAISSRSNAPAKPYVGGTGLYINANASDSQTKLAYEFAKWFATKGTEALVAKAGQFPASKDVALPADNPNVKAWTDQYANGVALPNSPKMSAVWTPADDMVNKVMIGGADPATAAKDAAATINKAG